MRSVAFDDGTFDYIDHTEPVSRKFGPCVPIGHFIGRQLRPTVDESIASAGNTFPSNLYFYTPMIRTPVRPLKNASRKPFFSMKDRQHIRNALD